MKSLKLIFVIYVCLTTLFISLGFWQLNRADQKRELLETQNSRRLSESLLITSGLTFNLAELRYRNAKIIGHYDSSHSFLLDNQVSEGKVGYFVFTPFVLQNRSHAVLINRGWIAASAKREDLPDVSFHALANQDINGRINYFPDVGIHLEGADQPSQTYPPVIQWINSSVLEKQFGYSLSPFQVELTPQADNGFKREWHITTLISPEKHIVYALQWFALAITLTVLMVWHGIKKK